MANIFDTKYKDTETWTAQGAIVTWSTGTATTGSATVPILMQSIQISYQRKMQNLWPLNQANNGNLVKVNIAGAPVGQLVVQGIYAPTTAGLSTFLTSAGKACKTAATSISMCVHPYGTGSCTGTTAAAGSTYKGQTFTLTGVELENLQFQIQSGETSICAMPLQFSFTQLDYTEGAFENK